GPGAPAPRFSALPVASERGRPVDVERRHRADELARFPFSRHRRTARLAGAALVAPRSGVQLADRRSLTLPLQTRNRQRIPQAYRCGMRLIVTLAGLLGMLVLVAP